MKHTFLILAALLLAGTAYAQRETQIQAPQEPAQYGRRFFVQLRAVFGRFRESDLDRVFEKAQPIECSELINESGEWRTVAFFNENRTLGDWYRSSFEEVKTDLSVFIFKGMCRGNRAPVQLVTKFPVRESLDAFERKQIGLDEIEVNVNAPVRASFDGQTQAYTFDLPYLFLVSEKDGDSIYSLEPPRLLDRTRYATDVTDHWDCKSVAAENVTYQFLICRTSTQPRNPAARDPRMSRAFGSSAYFILSDGREASSNVKLSFGDGDTSKEPVADLSKSDEPVKDLQWVVPDPDERLAAVLREEFRIHFNPQSWEGRMGSSQGFAGQQMSSLASFNPPQGANSCIWTPGSSSAAGDPAGYSISVKDREALSSTSISLRMRMANGGTLGTLECFFPRSADAASITFGQWKSIVGPHLTLEVR